VWFVADVTEHGMLLSRMKANCSTFTLEECVTDVAVVSAVGADSDGVELV
jgi:hypothetical protein